MTTEDYFKKHNQRLAQKILLTFSHKKFQEDMAILRKKWNIPAEGIKTEKENISWHRKLSDDTTKYFEKNREAQRNLVLKLESEKKWQEADKQRKEFNKVAPLNSFQNDLWQIVLKYKLPHSWKDSVKQYLLFNYLNNLSTPLTVTIENSWNMDTMTKSLSLLIDADTTLDDIKAIWPSVMEEQKTLSDYNPAKFQPIPNLLLDKRVFELKNLKKTHSDISNTIESEFGKSNLAYKDINEAVRRHKKRLGLL